MRFFNLLLVLSLVLLTACGGDVNEQMLDQGKQEEDGMDLNPNNESAALEVVPMPPTNDFPGAAITDWTYDGGTFNYAVENYEFGDQTDDADRLMCANSAKGQHAHLIINNEPYIAKYDPTFEHPLPDGQHHILTFLSRSYHESIKTPEAHRAVLATVTDSGFEGTQDITEPMLFYSRPKGTYRGKKETENVMLDFYPVNVELGDEYQVKATINGKDFMLNDWKPYYIKGLPLGENTVTLTLMASDSIVNTPLNPVKRTFTLEALPEEMGK